MLHESNESKIDRDSAASTDVLLAIGRAGAGFDCHKASTPVKRMICADPQLLELDEELTTAYADVKGDGYEPMSALSLPRNFVCQG